MNSNIIEKLPIPISGLILAILSLGNLIQGYPRLICGTIGVILIISLLLKLFLYPYDVKNDLSNPIILSSSGTFSMSLMILSTYVNVFDTTLAISIWILGLALHILLIIYFSYRYIVHDFNINDVYPSYWIVFVGITMGAITAHVHGLLEIAFIFFSLGFMGMLIFSPLIIFRYIRHPNKLDQNKPLICIFTALMSILIVGYTNSAKVISYEFIMALYAIGLVFFIFAFYKFIEYRNLDFYPSFSAFTFPFVITAISSKEVFSVIQSPLLNVVVLIQTLIAVVLVIYVFCCYLKFLFN